METELSDEALVERIRAGSAEVRPQLVNELFSRHYERVARWCYRFTGERDAAADLAQDVFLKAHRHLHTFQSSARFTTWLYVIARNESLTRIDRRSSQPVHEDEEALADTPALGFSPEDMAARDSRSRRLHAFLVDTLDETERKVFTLHYGADMPLDTITRLLHLQNASGAKAFIVSAKRKLTRAAERRRARGELL